MKIILLSVLLAQVPTNQFLGDYLKTEIVWTYSCTKNCPILGFTIACRPSTSDTYTNEVDVASAGARRYLIGLTIDSIINKYSPKAPMQVFCGVQPYNKIGYPYETGGPNDLVSKPWFDTRAQ